MKEVILAIETSCDDTSAAIAIDGIVKSNIIISQGIHSKHGGVVPEISSREHQKNIILVVEEALRSAKILGIEYPGGPIIDKISKNGDPLKYKFSKPRISDLNFSFSGIKTSILYFVKSEIEKDPMFVEKNLNDIAASIQYSLVEILK